MSQSIVWREDGETAVVMPQPGQKIRVQVPPSTHYAEASKKEENAIEIRPKE